MNGLRFTKGFSGFTIHTRTKFELGGSRMERSSLWKNFLLLTVGGLLALHLNVASAQVDASSAQSADKTEGCILEE